MKPIYRVPCPNKACAAPPYTLCRTRSGAVTSPHVPRKEAMRRLAKDFVVRLRVLPPVDDSGRYEQRGVTERDTFQATLPQRGEPLVAHILCMESDGSLPVRTVLLDDVEILDFIAPRD